MPFVSYQRLHSQRFYYWCGLHVDSEMSAIIVDV